MRRPGLPRSGALLAMLLAMLMALAPAVALARAGNSLSMGSRGTRTYSPPPVTNTAPSVAAPMQRTLTPNAPTMPGTPGMAGPGMAGVASGGGRSPFVSGLMGGFIGAGIAGLLFGGGIFHGVSGMGGFLGMLLQILIVVLLARWVLRRIFASRPAAFASPGGGMFARNGMAAGGGVPPRRGGRPVAISQADFSAFEQLLRAVQAAWSAHDLATMRRIATPEMASYFAEQMGEQTSRGVRNLVENVHLQQGDLAEAWAEDAREYATVAMRFTMTDVTLDQTGRVVDGDPNEQVEATELWTFLRAVGGNWVLSAIQQAG